VAGVGGGGRRDGDAVRGGEESERDRGGRGLLARVSRRLRAEERLQGRARLPGELGRAARRLGEEARLRRGRA